MIFSIVSASGGQGCSTLAAGLCVCFSQMPAKRVLAVDCCANRGLERQLGLYSDSSYDLGDALCGRCCAGDAVSQAKNGLFIVSPPSDDSELSLLPLKDILLEFSLGYDIVIVNLPNGSFSMASGISSVSDVTVICSTGRFADVETNRILRRRLPDRDERCRLVLSMYSLSKLKKGRVLGIDSCIDKVGCRLLGVVPFDGSAVNSPPDLTAGSPISQACGNIALRLLGKEDIPLAKL